MTIKEPGDLLVFMLAQKGLKREDFNIPITKSLILSILDIDINYSRWDRVPYPMDHLTRFNWYDEKGDMLFHRVNIEREANKADRAFLRIGNYEHGDIKIEVHLAGPPEAEKSFTPLNPLFSEKLTGYNR